jgi:predicted phosphodiesterase
MSNKTSFQIISDLHLEKLNSDTTNITSILKPVSPYLILAGDICHVNMTDRLENFLRQVCSWFELVIYVPGNHEYYSTPNYPDKSISEINKILTDFEYKFENLRILNRKCIMINNICILGCTLWSQPKINVNQRWIKIKDITTQKYEKMFNDDLEYIENTIFECKNNNMKLLVVTHYCPSFDLTKKYTSKHIRYKSLYASGLDLLLKQEYVDTWIYGHTHVNVDIITDGGTHVVSNQKGKPREKVENFSTNKIVYI